MNMKKPRCKHKWEVIIFSPPELRNRDQRYNCWVTVKCNLCNIEKSREPTTDEFNVACEKQFCKFCGEHNSEHDTELLKIGSPFACMRVLFERIRRIEERLENASLNV